MNPQGCYLLEKYEFQLMLIQLKASLVETRKGHKRLPCLNSKPRVK